MATKKQLILIVPTLTARAAARRLAQKIACGYFLRFTSDSARGKNRMFVLALKGPDICSCGLPSCPQHSGGKRAHPDQLFAAPPQKESEQSGGCFQLLCGPPSRPRPLKTESDFK